MKISYILFTLSSLLLIACTSGDTIEDKEGLGELNKKLLRVELEILNLKYEILDNHGIQVIRDYVDDGNCKMAIWSWNNYEMPSFRELEREANRLNASFSTGELDLATRANIIADMINEKCGTSLSF